MIPHETDNGLRYGFYSKEAEESCGSVVYLNLFGNEVIVTNVSVTREAEDYMFKDKQCVGIVTTYVRVNKKSEIGRILGTLVP